MADPRQLGSLSGCANPLCPNGNWSVAGLPRWSIELDDGHRLTFAACDRDCARAGARVILARLGRPEQEPRPTE